ncbi:hypothetical protein QO009_003039 [Brevibacillus aydinogluensis]|jgi:hypothetical protein|uniref:hypothetical protein n=1 Tax=Brevibacillus aydinogluensis TaxID=927786 RepID=UPI002892B41D|nr:hypothetical protein [Brevibacillus aydinogluensis]MDT3417144.1 hypothetical protein [Brevibacillus aydinogluensis]
MIVFQDEDGAIICSIPSKSGGGMYLVRVYSSANQMVVEHTCPANQFKTACSHIEQAVGIWKMLHPWEFYPWMPQKEIICARKHVVLRPHWKQIMGKGAGTDATEYSRDR